jgi:hypothetical protein
MGPASKQTFKIRLSVQVLKMVFQLVSDGVSEEQRKVHNIDLLFLPSS